MAAGELDAAVADEGGVAFRERADKVVGVGEPRRLSDCGGFGAWPAVGDVLRDGAAEEQHVLRHDRELPAQPGQRVVA